MASEERVRERIQGKRVRTRIQESVSERGSNRAYQWVEPRQRDRQRSQESVSEIEDTGERIKVWSQDSVSGKGARRACQGEEIGCREPTNH